MPVLPALPANNPFRINGRLLERYLDTVEVRSSSLLVPTIFLYHLTSLTSLREAPNGSIKRAEPGREGGRNEFDTSSERGWTIFGEADSPIGRCSGLHSGFPAIHAQSQEPVLTACPGVRLDRKSVAYRKS